jgi:inner membrane protein CreD
MVFQRLGRMLSEISRAAHHSLRTSWLRSATYKAGGAMSASRLIAIAFIYGLATLAWVTLGTSILARTGEFDSKLEREVTQLWGGRHRQVSPSVWVQRPRQVTDRESVAVSGSNSPMVKEVTRTVTDMAPVRLLQSRIATDLKLTQRQKGLLWYDTYAVTFSAHYKARNPDSVERVIGVELHFPSADTIYDQFVFRVNGQAAPPASDLSKGLTAHVTVPPMGEVNIDLAYASRGLDDWTYAFAEQGVGEVSDFDLAVTTDFTNVDFPAGSMSPTTKKAIPGGWILGWRFGEMVTGQHIGVDLPNRVNPGPLAARLTAFAPVSLLFFLAVMVILGVIGGQSLHPVNYAFLSAAFFAFHLLLAYLVDHISIHQSFFLSSIVSVFLVVSYLRIVAGTRFAIARAGVAQFVFLVLFSYAFFFEGYTGLTVTIGAIVTLFVMMQATARVDWGAVFAARARREA